MPLEYLDSITHPQPFFHAPTCALQDVINASFARAASTEQALLLLRQFESLLARESFRADLDAKYLQAFQVRWLCMCCAGSWHTLSARRALNYCYLTTQGAACSYARCMA